MKKAKGVKKNIIKNQITHDDYKICLENKITKTIKQKMIRSTKHKIYTIEQNKRGLSSFEIFNIVTRHLKQTHSGWRDG